MERSKCSSCYVCECIYILCIVTCCLVLSLQRYQDASDILLQAQGPQFLSDIIQPDAPFQTASYVLCKLTQFCNPYVEMEFSVLA